MFNTKQLPNKKEYGVLCDEPNCDEALRNASRDGGAFVSLARNAGWQLKPNAQYCPVHSQEEPHA